MTTTQPVARDWSGPPRTAPEAVAAVLPDDATYTMAALLDAMRVLPQFGDPDKADIDPRAAVIGNRRMWTYAHARDVVDHAFGPDGHDNLKHIVATWRVESVAQLDDVFFLRCAILLHAGWTQDDGWLWWTVCHPEISLELAAAWVGSWDLESLNMCISAHMSTDELAAIVKTGQRPDPDAIRALVALLPSRDGWNRTY